MITTWPPWLTSVRTVTKTSGPDRPSLRAELACQVRRVASDPIRSSPRRQTRPPANIRRKPGPGGTGMPPRAWCPSGPSASCGGRSSRYTQCHSSGSSSSAPGTPSNPASACAGPGVISSVTSWTSVLI